LFELGLTYSEVSENNVFTYNPINETIRPKSLQGIENNNGWIKGTPKEDMDCHILFSDGTQSIDRFLKEHGNFICNHYVSVTHYQPIEKPKPPIY